jgi:hypothetical protein
MFILPCLFNYHGLECGGLSGEQAIGLECGGLSGEQATVHQVLLLKGFFWCSGKPAILI